VYGANGHGQILFGVGADTLKLVYNSSHWDGYINGDLVATGTVNTTSTWQHVQVHIIISDTGTFDCKVEGSSNFTYSGDTKPGVGTTISYVQFYCPAPGGEGQRTMYCDDIAIGTGGWPGDLRVDGLVPNGDDTAEWTPSTGGTDYGCVDETPANDADYISTTVTGERAVLTLADFDGVNKTPMGVTLLVRMCKDTANADTIKFGLLSDTTESVVNQVVTTSLAYYSTFFQKNPDGDVDWDDAALDALKIVLENVIA
jgi:hypothetical protein